jgi:hypothetical protein
MMYVDGIHAFIKCRMLRPCHSEILFHIRTLRANPEKVIYTEAVLNKKVSLLNSLFLDLLPSQSKNGNTNLGGRVSLLLSAEWS